MTKGESRAGFFSARNALYWQPVATPVRLPDRGLQARLARGVVQS